MRVAFLLLALLIGRPAVPEGPAVPRALQVSVGLDHVWASVRATVRPADLGLPDWSRYDRDGDGVISDLEERVLLRDVRGHTVQYACVALDDVVVPLGTMPIKRVEPAGPLAADAAVKVRIEGRAAAVLGPGEHAFVLHDRPATAEGVVPIRLSFTKGFSLVGAAGARAERKGARRLESVVSHAAPAVWGTLRRDP